MGENRAPRKQAAAIGRAAPAATPSVSVSAMAAAMPDVVADADAIAEQAVSAAAERMDVATGAALADAMSIADRALDGLEEAAPAALPLQVNDTPSLEVGTDPVKGLIKMATAAPATAQAMFGDMNDRAKGMIEKTTKMSEEMVELTKGNVEALVASARVAAKGSEAFVQDAAEYGKKSFESATSAFKSFAAVKSPTELFQLQSDYAKTAFDSAVAEASKVSEGMLKLIGEMVQPLSSRYAVASEKMKAVAL